MQLHAHLVVHLALANCSNSNMSLQSNQCTANCSLADVAVMGRMCDSNRQSDSNMSLQSSCFHRSRRSTVGDLLVGRGTSSCGEEPLLPLTACHQEVPSSATASFAIRSQLAATLEEQLLQPHKQQPLRLPITPLSLPHIPLPAVTLPVVGASRASASVPLAASGPPAAKATHQTRHTGEQLVPAAFGSASAPQAVSAADRCTSGRIPASEIRRPLDSDWSQLPASFLDHAKGAEPQLAPLDRPAVSQSAGHEAPAARLKDCAADKVRTPHEEAHNEAHHEASCEAPQARQLKRQNGRSLCAREPSPRAANAPSPGNGGVAKVQTPSFYTLSPMTQLRFQ